MPPLRNGEAGWDVPVGEIVQPVNETLSPDMSLTEALDGFLRENVRTLPVMPGQWRHVMLGEVSRDDALLAIRDSLTITK